MSGKDAGLTPPKALHDIAASLWVTSTRKSAPCAAKTLGLVIPGILLTRADEVIE